MPEMSFFKNGFPHLRVNQFTDVRDYSRAFSPEEHPLAGPILYSEVPSFERLVEYATKNEAFKVGVTKPGLKPDVQESYAKIAAASLAKEIIDRLMHTSPGEPPTRDQILALYLVLEAPILSEELPIEILIPICLTDFGTQQIIPVTDRVAIERMDEPTQVARFPTSWSMTTVSDTVLGAAHHALVLSGWSMPASAWRSGRYFDLDFYPVALIEQFFRALYVVTAIPTGFAHFFIRPIDWAEQFIWKLPPVLQGPRLRRYPEWLEDFGWLREPWVVTEEQLAEIVGVFEVLQEGDPRMDLATQRLSSAMLRMEADDAIVDLCIALEALVGGDGNEITHKLALRVAAICVASGTLEYPGDKIFAAVKRIYGYRSAVVHGGQGASRYATVSGLQQDPLPTSEVALTFARAVIRALIKDPRYMDRDAVDRDLIAASAGIAVQGVEEGKVDTQNT